MLKHGVRHEMPVVGLIRFDGADNEHYLFSTDSWSGSGDEYTIAISKHDGTISCTCMDATCRRKVDRINAQDPRICKHARAVLRWASQLTGEQT